MKPSKRVVSVSLIFTLLFLLTMFGVVVAQEHHWGYEGEVGPDHWGDLEEDYALCADGSAQSPIDVTNATGLDLIDIEFNYGDTAMNILNNGHTIQVNADEGNSIVYNGIAYNLLQFHFHNPSEHTVDGEAAPMEIHFVHQDPNSGTLAVVGVMLVEGEADNAAYADIFANLPTEESEPDAMGMSVALSDLLPEQHTFYTYQGSLTTPPCSEIVRWLLLDTPVELSAGQIEAFAAVYEGNARPTQERGNRDLLVDTDT